MASLQMLQALRSQLATVIVGQHALVSGVDAKFQRIQFTKKGAGLANQVKSKLE
jgi:hypothetical protein